MLKNIKNRTQKHQHGGVLSDEAKKIKQIYIARINQLHEYYEQNKDKIFNYKLSNTDIQNDAIHSQLIKFKGLLDEVKEKIARPSEEECMLLKELKSDSEMKNAITQKLSPLIKLIYDTIKQIETRDSLIVSFQNLISAALPKNMTQYNTLSYIRTILGNIHVFFDSLREDRELFLYLRQTREKDLLQILRLKNFLIAKENSIQTKEDLKLSLEELKAFASTSVENTNTTCFSNVDRLAEQLGQLKVPGDPTKEELEAQLKTEMNNIE
jgi:hypothetical protein